MGRKQKPRRGERTEALKRTTLATGLTVIFAFSILIGVTGGAMGFGSMYPQLNFFAKPFVCSGGQMSYSQQVSEDRTARYYTARWTCVNEQTGERWDLDPNSVYIYAGFLYGHVLFVVFVFICYVYWNSSVGPARNGGPQLW